MGWLLSRIQARDIRQHLELLAPHLEEAGRRQTDLDLVVTNGLSMARTREEATTRFQNSMFTRRMDVVSEVSSPGSGTALKPSEDMTKHFVGTADDVIE